MSANPLLQIRGSKFLKTSGFIYFIFNIVISVMMITFAVNACMSSKFSFAYFIFILPLSGIFTGYCIRKGKYGWWRSIIIAINIMLTFAILFTAVFISPKLEQVKKDKFEDSHKQTPIEMK